MKKVMCINGHWPVAVSRNEPYPSEGDIVTVVRSFIYMPWGVYYILEGFSPTFGYDADKFADLSEIDETEMIREFKTQTMKTSLILLKIWAVAFFLLSLAFGYGYFVTDYWAFIVFAGIAIVGSALSVLAIIETKEVMKGEEEI